MTVIRSATESTVCHQNGGQTWLDVAMKLDDHQWQRKEKHSNRSLNRSKKISCSYPKIVKQEEGKAKFTSNLSKETENYRSIARWTLKSNGKSGKITKSTTGRELRCAWSIRAQGHSAKAACEKSGENKKPPSRSPVACVDAENISVGFFVGARKDFLLSLRVSRRKPLGNACYAGYRRGCNIPAFLPLGPLFIFYF